MSTPSMNTPPMNAAPYPIPDTWTSATFERPGVRIRYHRGGGRGRPPMLLLHGATDDGLCWLRVAKHLDDRYDLVMPDARGHGDTETGADTKLAMPGMADDAAALVEHLELGPVTVMGHSMGAQVATELAARRPDLVAKLVLEDPAYALTGAGGLRVRLFGSVMRAGTWWMRHRSEQQIRKLADRLFKQWTDDDKGPWAHSQYEFSRRRSLGDLMAAFDTDRDWDVYFRKITAPVLLVTAEKGLVKDDEAAAVIEALPDGTRTHIPHAGHNVRRDNFPDFIAAVTGFLEPS